ncbi:antibiotic biosynthesis monooxygenase [Actinosynnema sp. NPDC091369]
MIIEYIGYRVPADRVGAFESAFRRAAVHLAAAPECHDFELTRADGEHVVRLTWADDPERFRAGPHHAPFAAELADFAACGSPPRRHGPVDVGRATPTLYEWAGGAEAFEALFHAFYRRVPEDELLAPLFADVDPGHAHHVAAWLGEVFGGPRAYSTTRGGHRGMVGRHVGKGITEQQRKRWVSLLLDTAEDVGLPDDPEFRSAFVGYLEWGTRMAVVFSAPDARTNPAEPMPTWDWGNVRPWRG